jgi:CBS domain-containing protein
MYRRPREVRDRVVLVGGRAEPPAHRTVFCPMHERSLDASTCAGCAYGGPLEAGEADVVRCCFDRDGAEASLRIGEVMGSRAYCVRDTLDVDALTALFVGEGISGAPVVDASGRPIGVVSKTDLVRSAGARTVADIMTPVTLTLPETASVYRAAALMAYESVHRVVVTDDAGQVVGVLSALDVLRWLARDEGYVVPTRRTAAHGRSY